MSEVQGRQVSGQFLDRAAMIAMSAARAEQVMNTVVGAFSLIIEEMADLRNPPDADKVDEWCNITHWLTSQLQGECKNIRSSMQDARS